MLIDVKIKEDEATKYISQFQENSNDKKIEKGVYEIEHFNFEYNILTDLYVNTNPSFDTFDSYGVCDELYQIFELCPEIKDSLERKFVISLTWIDAASQPMFDGWRWHKWGTYIGNHKIKSEYIYDQKDEIEGVYVYKIIEIGGKKETYEDLEW